MKGKIRNNKEIREDLNTRPSLEYAKERWPTGDNKHDEYEES